MIESETMHNYDYAYQKEQMRTEQTGVTYLV